MKKILRSFLVLFLFAFFGSGALILNFIIFPFINFFISEEKRIYISSNIIHSSWKFFINMILFCKIIRINFHNKDRLKDIKGKIIVANHPTYIDILILIANMKNTLCVAKKELKKNFFMANIVKTAYIVNDENNLEFINETKNALDSGFNIIIFPTGTRTEENKELKLHKGASNLAVQCNKDIIPVYINCSRKFLAKGQKVYDAGRDIIDFDITINETIKIEEINGLNLTEIQKRNRINEIIKKRITKS